MPCRLATAMTLSLALLALGAAGPAISGAGAAAKRKAPGLEDSPLLWATVNVCDTAAHPDTVGLRGSMPGSGIRKEEMFMRFQLQYFSSVDKRWHNVGKSGDSGFIDVGSAKYKARQTGRNFTVVPPEAGAYILRGAVTYEWRRGPDVVRRARERTHSGQGDTAGADPSGFSAATCHVKKGAATGARRR